MSHQIQSKKKVLITGAPKNCNLKEIKTKILEVLPNKHAVDKVQKCKTVNGEVIPGKFEITLASEEDLQVLVNLAVIEIEYDDALYTVKVTRSRPKTPNSGTTTAVSSTNKSKCSHEDESTNDNDKNKNDDSSDDGGDDRSEKDLLNLSMKPTTWFDILQTDPELFENYRDNCILIQLNSGKNTKENLLAILKKETFGTNLLQKILCLKDGFLLVYNEQRAARNVLEEEDSITKTLNIKVFEKPIPEVYEDRMLLKGKFEKSSTDDVRNVVECCTDVSFNVKKLKESGMVLVVFDEPLSIDLLKGRIKRLHLSNINPQVIKVCRSDCIKVQNVKESVSDDIIKLYFMNKKYSSGSVTFVDRPIAKSKTAFVYFANYKDAENLAEVSKKIEVFVDKIPVGVSLFCCGVNDTVEFSSDSLYQFYCELEIDNDIGKFVLKSRDQLSNLYKELGDVANAELILDPDTENYCVKVKPISQKEDGFVQQETFENECRNRITRFFKKFKTVEKNFEMFDPDRVKEMYQWNDEESFIEKEIQKTLVSVFVRWSSGDKLLTKVIGIQKHVDLFLSWFEKTCNHAEEHIQFTQPDFNILIYCGIYENMLDTFEDAIAIQPQNEKQTLVFSGSKEVVKTVITATKTALKRIMECDMSFLHPCQLEFLERSFSNDSSNKPLLLEYIQDKLIDQHVKVLVLKQKNQLLLKYDGKNRHALERAQEEIRSMLKIQVIPIDNYYDELVSEKEWKDIQAGIESSKKLCIIEDKSNSSITLVGLPSVFNQHYEKISTFLENNAETETTVHLTYAKATFFSMFSEETGADECLKNVEWFKEPGGIHIKGRACLVNKATEWVKTTAQAMITQSKQLSVLGMASYLRGGSGKQFLQTTSKASTCVILLDSDEPLEWIKAKPERNESKPNFVQRRGAEQVVWKENPNDAPASKGILEKTIDYFFGKSVVLTAEQKSSVHVSIVHGDILTSDCAAMINTVGKNFDLTLSKVSSALIKRAGGNMIEECQEYPLIKTDVLRVTGAPNLSFKNIVHLVTPKKPEKICEYLLDVFKIIEEKLQHGSLAIPAIGTGQIGLNDIEVAKSIRKAIDLFKKTIPNYLKRIDVFVYENQMIPAFTSAFKDTQKANTSPQQTYQSAQANLPNPAPHFGGTQSPTVLVQSGDILNSNCEVLVNTVGPDFNLTTSLLSAKVLQKAGQGINNECQTNPVVSSPAYRITSGGNSGFQNIAHFVTLSACSALSNNLFHLLVVIDKKLMKKSVAIPAIGTGNAGLQSTDVANAFASTFTKFSATNPKNLRTIEVVIFQPHMLADFQSSINSSSPNPSFAASGYKPKPKPRKFTFNSQHKQQHYLVLYFTSNNRNSIEQAFEKIQNKAREKCSKKVIKDEVLELLEADDLEELQTLEREYDVCLKTSNDKSIENELEIFGRAKDVAEAYAKALEMLKNFGRAVTCADYIVWKYKDPQTKVWINHSLKANYDLESAYKENKAGNCKTKMTINGNKKNLTINFSKMKQSCQGLQTVCDVKRSELSSSTDFPSFWKGNKSRQLVTLDNQQHTNEYQIVLNKFQNSFGNSQQRNMRVVRLERVENKRLFRQFSAQKNEVEERVKNATRELFHGTSSDVCEKIYKDGFNRSYAGKNATAFGKGVYFATTSSYSHGYTHPNHKGERQMFLAEVVTGEFVQGNQTMIDPPRRQGGSSADLYESVVNNVQSPTIFVVFKDASVYPLYLLTYT